MSAKSPDFNEAQDYMGMKAHKSIFNGSSDHNNIANSLSGDTLYQSHLHILEEPNTTPNSCPL